MASYPSIPFVFGSDESIKDGVTVDRAMDGSGRARNLWTAKKRAYTLKHTALTATQKGTLETFYDTNRAVPVSLTWTDGTARDVILTGIKIVPWHYQASGRLWDVQITAEQI